ncbi:hypothetical protein RhiirC2_785686 [Rhizophagus irregularis]|uniref:Uncharacterized protein n=1 Tax=Rhizophagus irregularis TaxID=588596 RepID=A0A2N1MVU6_9GLOM|nr:hypothetical protein RhiirC2_785686 [Rhizophagus irregularis]
MVYKATWIDGPVNNYDHKENICFQNYTVVLKKINGSKNITSKELNELKVFYDYFSESIKMYSNCYFEYNVNIGKYFEIAQDPNSQDIMIIMPYYNSGDYITKDFFNISSWCTKIVDSLLR